MWRHSVATGLVVLTIALSGMHLGRAEAWQAQWQRTVEAAKKEGRLNIYASSSVELLLTREFQKRYPEIRVITGVPGGGRALPRIMAERRAGQYITDLYFTGSTSIFPLYAAKHLDPIKPALILPEVTDQSSWWEGKHRYPDPEGRYIFSFEGIFRVDVTYNTNLLNPTEVKSYWDFLNPKWKGKIIVLDPKVGRAGTGLRFLYYHPELGPEFLRKLLTQMDVTISRDERQMMDWLGQGKFAFAMFPAPAVLEAHVAKAQGLPVDWFGPRHFKEGAALTSSGSNVVLLNKAPHPNAAKVAVNWLLSREGQIAFQKIHDPGHDSLRIDIPKNDVPPFLRRVDAVRYLDLDKPEMIDLTPIRDLIAKLLDERQK